MPILRKTRRVGRCSIPARSHHCDSGEPAAVCRHVHRRLVGPSHGVAGDAKRILVVLADEQADGCVRLVRAAPRTSPSSPCPTSRRSAVRPGARPDAACCASLLRRCLCPGSTPSIKVVMPEGEFSAGNLHRRIDSVADRGRGHVVDDVLPLRHRASGPGACATAARFRAPTSSRQAPWSGFRLCARSVCFSSAEFRPGPRTYCLRAAS